MYVYIVKDITEYEGADVTAVFSTESAARDYARTANLFTDARSITRAELDNAEYLPEQIAFEYRDMKGEF